MPEYLAPGVYVEEIETGAKPIEGVGTSTAGFIGVAERGPTDARFLGSFAEYARLYGGHVVGSHLSHAVAGFFDNGGSRCFVARVGAKGDKTASLDLGGLVLQAAGPGEWGSRLGARVDP